MLDIETYLITTHCDRCQGPLSATNRISSWYGDDVICSQCSSKEREVRTKIMMATGKDEAGQDVPKEYRAFLLINPVPDKSH